MASILIVDDERIARVALRRVLREASFDCFEAKSGSEALAAFLRRRPDLVLLDLMMPGMDGFEVLKEIRALDALVPVIFLTGSDSCDAEIRGMRLGADDYISKSATRAQILARIDRALERNRQNARFNAAKNVLSIRIGEAKVDFSKLSIEFESGSIERLTGVEAIILRTLACDRSRYFPPQKLLDSLHREYGNTGDISSLRSQISRLKTKLGAAGKLLCGERNKGYRLYEDESDLKLRAI